MEITLFLLLMTAFGLLQRRAYPTDRVKVRINRR